MVRVEGEGGIFVWGRDGFLNRADSAGLGVVITCYEGILRVMVVFLELAVISMVCTVCVGVCGEQEPHLVPDRVPNRAPLNVRRDLQIVRWLSTLC